MPLETTESKTTEMTVNLGPQHPATHGVLRLVLDLNGETVVKCTPHVGYLHRGIEKIGETKTYTAALPLTDRLDYVSSMTNNVAYSLAVERLFGIEAPPRAKYIRTIMSEMSRISSHILWIATHALDIGAMTVFLYSFREREKLLDLFEMTCGARLTVAYPRIGGVRCDVGPEFLRQLRDFTDEFPRRVREYETLIDQNRIWLQRTKGIGFLSAEDAINWGVTGPTLRGSGPCYDVRKDRPYDAYADVDFDVPVGAAGDLYDRYRCRMEELLQSNRIIRQCLDKLPDGPILAPDAPDLALPYDAPKKKIFETSLDHASIAFSHERDFFPAGEIYSAIEAPKGELGFYIISDGNTRPYRMRVRSPSFIHVSVLPKLCEGHLVADVIANIGTIDVVLGECDR
ncbi:MAG TPA: NADH dehydrogenase (quinone) subunit D [Nitrospirota bacterium]|nr:NADH dehydrogenase (quinone) subunit D [Nitrospirota bacterium]